jgi:hypothetical protein
MLDWASRGRRTWILSPDVTALLKKLADGNQDAANELFVKGMKATAPNMMCNTDTH